MDPEKYTYVPDLQFGFDGTVGGLYPISPLQNPPDKPAGNLEFIETRNGMNLYTDAYGNVYSLPLNADRNRAGRS